MLDARTEPTLLSFRLQTSPTFNVLLGVRYISVILALRRLGLKDPKVVINQQQYASESKQYLQSKNKGNIQKKKYISLPHATSYY